VSGKTRERAVLAATRFEARCVWCGTVGLEPENLSYQVSGREALATFACPSCSRLNVRALRRVDAAALLVAGVRRSEGPVPFELLEMRSGPPIGWDDLIDFHQALAGNDRPPNIDAEREAA
jgi:hypothetical protein